MILARREAQGIPPTILCYLAEVLPKAPSLPYRTAPFLLLVFLLSPFLYVALPFFWLSLFPFLTSSLPICHSSLTLYSGYPEIMYVHGGLLIIEWWICYLGKCSLWKFPPLTEIKARLYSTVSVWLCMYVHVYGCLYSRLRKREDEKEQELKTVLVVKEDR